VESGATLALVATPATGYTFSRWLVNGAQYSMSSTLTMTITADTTIQAVFTVSGITITLRVKNRPDYAVTNPPTDTVLSAVVGENFTIGAEDPQTFAGGTTLYLMYWAVRDINGNNLLTSRNNPYTFKVPADAYSVWGWWQTWPYV
jgi:hypothetical protein